MYQYLYRFSVERLHTFIRDPALVTLFKYYYFNGGERRIERSATMRNYREAYMEAALKII